MADDSSRLRNLRDRIENWFGSSAASGGGLRGTVRLVLAGLAVLIAIGLATATVAALVLSTYRAGDAILAAFLGAAPLLGRLLGYVFVAAMLTASAVLLFVALAVGIRLAALAATAVARETAARFSRQTEQYLSAALLTAPPAYAGYAISTQSAFEALPIELKEYLALLVLPFAMGAATALLWGRMQAIVVTSLALLGLVTIVVVAGYFEPTGTVRPGPTSVFLHWAELMRHGAAIQRIWWMLLVLLAIFIWAIAVFVGFRDRLLATPPTSKGESWRMAFGGDRANARSSEAKLTPDKE